MLKHVLMLCVAVGPMSLTAVADEAKSDEKEKPQRFEVRVEKVVTSEKSDDDNEAETKVSGQIVIMGPDGKVKEYSLDDELPESVRVLIRRDKDGEHSDEEHNVFVFESDAEEAEERLMIGVHCDAADDVLRSHLKLEDAGLIVLEVIDDSPAMEAGIKENDVIFRANGAALDGVKALVDVVQESDGKTIEFGVVRSGERMEVQIKPRMMEMGQHFVIDHLQDLDIELGVEGNALKWTQNLEQLDLPEEAIKALKGRRAGVRLRKVQPGIVIDRALEGEELQDLIEDVRAKAMEEALRAREAHDIAREAHEHAREIHEHAHEEHKKAAENVRVEVRRMESTKQSVESVHAQMKELQAQMKELQKTLEKLSAKSGDKKE